MIEFQGPPKDADWDVTFDPKTAALTITAAGRVWWSAAIPDAKRAELVRAMAVTSQ